MTIAHNAALARIEALRDAPPGTPEHDECEVLSILVAAYAEKHWPILPPDPDDARQDNAQFLPM